jgi:hypothetical protein
MIDARNVLDPERVRQHGFLYFGTGRGTAVEREFAL